MERLLIIDGNNLMFQMFYGMPAPIYNKSGRPIHGTIGFISFVIKEIKTYDITRCVVVFDSESAKERIEEYPEYKANRIDNWDEMDPFLTPFSQEEDIKRALEYMGIKYIYSTESEADDYISQVALMGEKNGEVLISSFDSDFFQLIGERISVLRYRGKASVLWDRKRFLDEFGFPPSYYALYKSILGDASDNIKGIEGMGKKRTGSFIRHVEENGEFYGSPLSDRLKKNMREGQSIIERNLSLITFKRVFLPLVYGDLCFSMERVEEGNSKVLEKAGVFS